MKTLQTPNKDAIIFEDNDVYVCLASYPLTKGHLIVACKENLTDLHLLDKAQFEHLMWVVEIARNSLLKTLSLEKVYLMYMDEIKHVHWHLIPRYNEEGYNLLKHRPELNTDFSLVEPLKLNWDI